MLTVLTLAAAGLGLYVAYFFSRYVPPLLRDRLLFKQHLTREEQAKVEKNLSRLSRVIVMCDRFDPPSTGFLDAVSDNLSNGVKYLFLISHKATDDLVVRYSEMFEQIELSVRAKERARSAVQEGQGLPEGPLYDFHRIPQDWDDYPYICYEFYPECPNLAPSYLMYRGNQMKVGIAERYVRVSPEAAYSLVKRADALKNFIGGGGMKNFVPAHRGDLENTPVGNILQIRSGKSGS